MNSFNHFALGAVGQWMYEFQLGITNDHGEGEAGYKHFVLQPAAGEKYTSLKGSYNSHYGEIKTAWEADGNGKMTALSANVPANTSATLYLPVDEQHIKFRSVKGAKFERVTTRNNIPVAQYELSSGSYSFIIRERDVVVKN